MIENSPLSNQDDLILPNWQSFFDCCPDLLCIISREGYLKEVNLAWERTLGWTSDELRSRPWLEFIHPEDLLVTKIVMKLALRNQSNQPSLESQKSASYTLQNRFANKDRTYSRLSWSISPYLNKYLYATVRDISEHVSARESPVNLLLQYPQEFSRLLFSNSFDGILTFDRECCYTQWNSGMEKIAGISADQVIGKCAFDVFPFLKGTLNEQYFYAALAGESGIIKDSPFITPTGEQGFLEISYSPLKDYLGRVIGGLGIIRDVSDRVTKERTMETLVQERTAELRKINLELQVEINERIQTEQRLDKLAQDLKRSNLELEQFAYVASHDLQEPLRAITSFTQLFKQHYVDRLDPKAEKYMGHIIDGASRMQQLINDLLAFSRAGRGDLKLEQTNCNTLIESVLRNLHLAIAESNAQINCTNLPIVAANSAQLGQLFQNLIANAIKFCRVHPNILIKAILEENYWHFSISDNGIGIESTYFDRIFIIFQRLHTRREYSGTGIGLAICKKIVERHNGKIWVESTLHEGSIFHFTIPVMDTESPSIPI